MYRMVTLLLASLFLLPAFDASAQQRAGTWAFGLRGGASLWLPNYNQRKVGPSGDLIVRYATSGLTKLSLTVGAEELKAGQNPPVFLSDDGVTVDYMKLLAFPFSVSFSFNFVDGPVSPYVYAGVGGMLYQRRVNADQYYPGKSLLFAPTFPVGIGLEAALSAKTILQIDLGARPQGGWVDLRKSGAPDCPLFARAGILFTFGSSDEDDNDEDGLLNGEERRYGTDPDNPDTDADGLRDGDEVHTYRTNPLKADTDGDGLLDGDEVYRFRTDPTKFDTDGDGLSDGDEVLKYKTDPLKTDTDGDGLTDGEEVVKYHTDPVRVDTDGDGLSDWDEVMVYKTDPRNQDTDADGLTDREEVQRYKTDPLKPDTDGGGVNDGKEVRRGTNPLDPRDDIPIVPLELRHGKRVILEGADFQDDTGILKPEADGTLKRLYQALKDNGELMIEVAGYTDNKGGVLKNNILSLRRAQTIKDWLVNYGIDPLRITVVGMGALDPVAPNSTAEGRAKNRRIEIHVK